MTRTAEVEVRVEECPAPPLALGSTDADLQRANDMLRQMRAPGCSEVTAVQTWHCLNQLGLTKAITVPRHAMRAAAAASSAAAARDAKEAAAAAAAARLLARTTKLDALDAQDSTYKLGGGATTRRGSAESTSRGNKLGLGPGGKSGKGMGGGGGVGGKGLAGRPCQIMPSARHVICPIPNPRSFPLNDISRR